MTADTLFSAYLDANIVLFLAAAVWMIARFVVLRSGLRHAFLTQLHMVYAALITVALTPIIVHGFQLLQRGGVIAQNHGWSLSDFAVAQFLHGRIGMAPSRFESLLMWRSEVTHDIATLSTPMGMAIGYGLAFGIACFALRTMRNVMRVQALVRRSYVWRRVGRVEIRLTDETYVPFSTRGFRRFYIVVPSALLSQSNDLRIAVSHELQHIRQGDLEWEIALEMARPLFFWNPAMGFWKREVEELRELACDQQVLARDTFGIKEYVDCLLRVCRNGMRRDRQLLVPSVPFAHVDESRSGSRSARFLRHRVLSMLQRRKRLPWLASIAVIVPVIMAIIIGSVASRQVNDWSHDRLMLSTIVNLERLNNRQGQ